MAIQIYLLDDHVMIRSALRSMLGQRENFDVVGDSGDPRAAIGEIEELKPDVVLCDITMPGLSGIDAVPRIREASPATRVVMLTHHEGESFVEQALQAGAEGYLSKDSDPRELALAVEAVHRGDPYVSPKVSSGLVSSTRRDERAGDSTPHRTRVDALTPREREVFQLLALGHSNKSVARELGISLGTAKKHRENLQRKLACQSPAELARLAIREGLLNL